MPTDVAEIMADAERVAVEQDFCVVFADVRRLGDRAQYEVDNGRRPLADSRPSTVAETRAWLDHEIRELGRLIENMRRRERMEGMVNGNG